MPTQAMPRRTKEFERFLVDQLSACWDAIYDLQTELELVRSLIPFADVARMSAELGPKVTVSFANEKRINPSVHALGLGLTSTLTLVQPIKRADSAIGFGVSRAVLTVVKAHGNNQVP